MSTDIPSTDHVVTRPVVTLLMVLCGIVGSTAATLASAAGADEAPRLSVHFDPSSLATDDGARALYHRLVKAAEQVCPDTMIGSRIVSIAAQNCRKQAVARAVRDIDNSRLAALDTNLPKRG